MKRLLLLCAVAAWSITAANAESVADFYRGKTISVYVGFPPGGGYDIYSRVVAPHFSRHIPGNPTVVVRNMEGGVGVRAAAYITSATAQDGTSLGMFLDGLTMSKVLGGPGAFSPEKFAWVGRVVSTATFAMVWHSAPAQTVEEARTREITMGATSVSSSSSYLPLALNDLFGTRIKVIRGYSGSAPITLAMERGEVNAHGGLALEAIFPAKEDWLTEKKARFFYYQGAQRFAGRPEVPALLDFATDDRSRAILGLLGGAVDIGRSLAAEPGTPPDRTAALRTAFMATMADPAFIEDMKKRNLSIEAMEGTALQKIIADAAATPAALVEQAQKYFKPQ
jgi:tripartite-type tricarboxylate transporter receptor subunit TctC